MNLYNHKSIRIEKVDRMKNLALQILGIGILCLAFVLKNPKAHADPSAAAFLKIDPSPRSYAMGRSRVVSSLGAQAVGANPANLQKLSDKYELFTTYSSLYDDAKYVHVSGAISRSRNSNRLVDAIGIAVTNLGVGGFETRDISGAKIGSFSARDTVVALSACGSTKLGIGLGVTGKFISSRIGQYSTGMSYATDIGMEYSYRKFAFPVRMGLSLSNMGRGIKFVNNTDPLPSSIDAGVEVFIAPLTVVLKTSHLLNDKNTETSVGLEYGIGSVRLRAGYRGTGSGEGQEFASGESGTLGEIFDGFSTGIGLHLKALKLDYALGQDSADFGLTHRMSVTFQWGKNKTRNDNRAKVRTRRIKSRSKK